MVVVSAAEAAFAPHDAIIAAPALQREEETSASCASGVRKRPAGEFTTPPSAVPEHTAPAEVMHEVPWTQSAVLLHA